MTPYFHRRTRPTEGHTSSAGFTLIEGLIVVVLIGLLAAIAAPSFLSFWQQRKINATQDRVYLALRATQAEAMQLRQERRFSLRERDGHIEWASHPETTLASQVIAWQPLIDGVVLADIDNTLLASGGIYYVRFDMYGNVRARLGTVTVAMAGGKTTHRCVVVSTMIGALRKGKGHTTANSGNRFCY
ncbi:MAG: prepilin-type N-terminal cleavage/methylation domain-containing protein [Cyanobacteria bacterium J06638_6]